MRLRPPTGTAARSRRTARIAAVLAGTAVLAVSLPATALAAPTVRTVTEAQISATPVAPGIYKAFEEGGTVAVVDEGARSYLRLYTPNGSSKAKVANAELYGKPLSELTALSYQTLIEAPGLSNAQQAPSINIEINPGEQGADYATLVWEPIYTGVPVTAGTWQTWTPTTTPTGSGGWWSTRADPLTTGVDNKWGFKSYTASFAEVLAALPAAKILSVGVSQGSGSAGLRAGVDQFRINDTTFDFDNAVVPTKLEIESGNGQSAVALKPFAQPLKVKVTGRDGTVPAPGATVEYKITGGSATFPGATPANATATATTDANGVATAPTLTAGLVPGPVAVMATSGTLSRTFTLTVNPPPGPPVADLALTVTGVPATTAPGATFTATLTVQNTSPFAATRVSTAASAPSGLRITAAPGGVSTGAAAAFVVPTLGPGEKVVHTVTFVVDRATRGARTITFATNSTVLDPNRLNNAVFSTVTVR